MPGIRPIVDVKIQVRIDRAAVTKVCGSDGGVVKVDCVTEAGVVHPPAGHQQHVRALLTGNSVQALT